MVIYALSWLVALVGGWTLLAFLKYWTVRTQRRWLNAGRPDEDITPEAIARRRRTRIFLAAVFGALLPLLVIPGWSWGQPAGALLAAALAYGYEMEVDARRQWIFRSELPDFLDLMAMGLSSGLNFQLALELSVHALKKGILVKSLRKMMQAVDWGQSRVDAVREMIRLFDDPEISGIFGLILQAMERGAPVQDLLERQAFELRHANAREIEKRAQTLGIKLLFPVVLFFLPSVFIVLFGALFLQLKTTGAF